MAFAKEFSLTLLVFLWIDISFKKIMFELVKDYFLLFKLIFLTNILQSIL